MSRNSFTVFFLILSIAAPALSQQNPATPAPGSTQQTEDKIRIGTTVVQMDVIVTDKTGRRVTGLTLADFEVRDEGNLQPLTFFTAIQDSRAQAGGTRAPAGAEGDKSAAPSSSLAIPFEGRYIVLIFDDLHLKADNISRARNSIIQYINTSLKPTDMVAVVSTGGSFAEAQQFTNDKQRLINAINRIIPGRSVYDKVYSTRFNLSMAEAIRVESNDTIAIDSIVRRVLNESLSSELTSREQIESQLHQEARGMVLEVGGATRSTLRALRSLVANMADLPGRKVVVLMTEQLLTAGFTTEDATNQINQLIDVSRRSGVSIYALDAVGLRTSNVSASERITGQGLRVQSTAVSNTMSDYEKLSAAHALTQGSGGALISNTNDLPAGLQRAVDDSSTYYVVGFEPPSLDNKFHRLTVTVKGKPDLIVRTRRGYLAVNQETVRGTGAELAAAIISPIPRIDLPLELVANVVPKAGEQVIITGLHVGRNYLTLPAVDAADQSVAYEVVAYLFAAGKDQPVGGIQRTFSFDLKDPQVRQKLKTEGFVHVSQFQQLDPGNYQLRAVIREKGTGMVGSAYQFFEIPDVKNRKQVSLSSIVLTPGGQEGFTGHHSFKRGTDVDVRYTIYNPPKEVAGLTQRMKLMNNQGQVMMETPINFTSPAAGSDGSVALQGLRFNLPTGVARGKYTLVVSLKDVKGKVELERRADFIVE